MNRILVIIPIFGKEDMTRKCIEKTLNNSGCDIDILVVDDGSKKPFKYDSDKNVYVLRLGVNGGFTNAINRGILWAGMMYEYIHLLNNDTEPKQKFLKVLVDRMDKDDSIGIIGSARLHANNNVELYGADLLRGYQMTTTMKDLTKEVIECDWIPFCSVLLRFSMIREIGLLDKHMKNHCSDNDYCFRAKQADYKVMLDTNSIVLHHHSVTVKEHKIVPESDQKVFLEKFANLWYAQLMKRLPLDAEFETYGQLKFEVITK
jgi:hypothetical protein